MTDDKNRQRLVDKTTMTVEVQADSNAVQDKEKVRSKKEKASKEIAKPIAGKKTTKTTSPDRIIKPDVQTNIEIAKIAIIIASIIGILYYFFFYITDIIFLIDNIIDVHSDGWALNFPSYTWLSNTFLAFRFIAFTVILIALVLLLLSLNSEFKKYCIFTISFFSTYTLFMIIYEILRLSESGSFIIVGVINDNAWVDVGDRIITVVFSILATISLVVSLVFIGSILKKAKKIYNTQPNGMMISPYVLSVFLLLQLVLFIVGAIIYNFASSIDVLRVVMFFVYTGILMLTRLVYIMVYSELLVKFARFDFLIIKEK